MGFDRNGRDEKRKCAVVVVMGCGTEVRILRNYNVFTNPDGRHVIAANAIRETTPVAHYQIPGSPDFSPGIDVDAIADLCSKKPGKKAAPRMERHRGRSPE